MVACSDDMTKLVAEREITDVLEDVYQGLSPRVRLAARYVQRNPAEVALYPLRKVAASAGVSPTTLVRLATDLGFGTYNAFKDAFRAHIRTGADRYAADASKLFLGQTKEGLEAFHASSFRAGTAALEETFRSITASEIGRAREALQGCETIYVLGMRSMFAPAFYFAYLLRTFSSNVVLVENRMDMLIDEIGAMSAKDALIVISYEPYSLAAVKAAEYAAGVGSTVIALTDTKLSPVSASATHVFELPTTSNSFYQSLLPAVALIETLASSILVGSGQDAIDRMAAEFGRRERFGVYWEDQR